MRILYSDSGLVACIKPVGLDSEAELPAVLKDLGFVIQDFTRLRLQKTELPDIHSRADTPKPRSVPSVRLPFGIRQSGSAL